MLDCGNRKYFDPSLSTITPLSAGATLSPQPLTISASHAEHSEPPPNHYENYLCFPYSLAFNLLLLNFFITSQKFMNSKLLNFAAFFDFVHYLLKVRIRHVITPGIFYNFLTVPSLHPHHFKSKHFSRWIWHSISCVFRRMGKWSEYAAKLCVTLILENKLVHSWYATNQSSVPKCELDRPCHCSKYTFSPSNLGLEGYYGLKLPSTSTFFFLTSDFLLFFPLISNLVKVAKH